MATAETEPPVQHRVLSLEDWNLIGTDALPPRSRRPDVLDRDPDGTMAKARGIYLRCLGRDPLDETGLVARAREIAFIITSEAERRRLVRDTAATEAKWNAIREAHHWPGYDIANNIWYGIPFTGEPELLYPELKDEDALTRGEWFDWTDHHKEAGAQAMIDHLKSLIGPNDGETPDGWTQRLLRRREAWTNDTDEVVVNKMLYPRRSGESHVEWIRRLRGGNPLGPVPVNRSLYAPPQQAGLPSPDSSRIGAGRKARRRRPRLSPAARPASAPR